MKRRWPETGRNCHGLCLPDGHAAARLCLPGVRTFRLPSVWTYKDKRVVCMRCQVGYLGGGPDMLRLSHCPCCHNLLRRYYHPNGDPTGRKIRRDARYARHRERVLESRPPRKCKECSAPLPRDAHALRQICTRDACRRAAIRHRPSAARSTARAREQRRDARGQRNCPECGALVPRTAHGNRRFCPACAAARRSAAHAAADRRRHAERNAVLGPRHCRICNAPFPRGASRRFRLCGSPECNRLARNEACRRHRASLRPPRGPPSPCAECGASLPLESHPTRKYCDVCVADAHRAVVRVSAARRYAAKRQKRIESRQGARTCPECGAAIPKEAHGSTRLCGSAACRKANQTKINARLRARVRASRPDRSCPECGAAIPKEAHGRRRLCGSADCRRANLTSRAGARYTAYREGRPARKCATCSAMIPGTAHALRRQCQACASARTAAAAAAARRQGKGLRPA